MEDWIAMNRADWDERAEPHAGSAEYKTGRFVQDPGFLSDVVRFDLPRLPDVRGLRGVHLSPAARPARRMEAVRRNRRRGPSATSGRTRSPSRGWARG